ncbi:transposase [Rhizobium laguerreae]|nr:transposase [Rhizobium laguerreae]
MTSAKPNAARHRAKAQPKVQRARDADLYKERKRIERIFSKLKQFRRAATRYDKLLVNVMGLAKLAAITVAIRVKQLSPVRLLRPGQLIVCGRTVDMLLYNAARKTRDPAGRHAYEMNIVHASCTPDRSKPGQPTEQAGFHKGDFPATVPRSRTSGRTWSPTQTRPGTRHRYHARQADCRHQRKRKV